MSGGAAVAWPGTQRRVDELAVRVPGTYPAGAHRLVLRSKAGAGGGELRAFSAAVEDERGTRLRTVTVPAEAAATGEWRETSAWFVLPAEGRIRLRFIVPARSAVTIDWADIRPGGERP
jgi:hypothetical protein